VSSAGLPKAVNPVSSKPYMRNANTLNFFIKIYPLPRIIVYLLRPWKECMKLEAGYNILHHEVIMLFVIVGKWDKTCVQSGLFVFLAKTQKQ